MKTQVQIAAAALVALTGLGTGAGAQDIDITPDEQSAIIGQFAAKKTLELRERFDRRIAEVRIDDRRDRREAPTLLLADARTERPEILRD